ncbi:MAG: hypothetical protein ACKPKO_36875, partial [Candidatus Fonsibacter sp.]
FPMKEKIDPSDSGYKMVTPIGSAMNMSKSLKPQWRRRRSVSRVIFGRKVAQVVRLSDSQVGFGRRKSPAIGESQKANTSRKAEPPVVLTPTPSATTTSANEALSKKAKDTLAMRAALGEMVDVAIRGRAPPGAEVPTPKRMPRSRSPPSFQTSSAGS